MNIKKIIGNMGEDKIAWNYRVKGYKIIARNFSCKYGELDIVAQKGSTIAIVEVKTRKNANFAHAKDYVDYKKQAKIKNTADIFLSNLILHLPFLLYYVVYNFCSHGSCCRIFRSEASIFKS